MEANMIIKEWRLHYCSGSSDKVYVARIEKRSDKFYGVPCEYGRRGAVLRPADKGVYRTLAEAERAFYDVVTEKTAKGYAITDRIESDGVKVESSIKDEIVRQLEAVGSATADDLAKALASEVVSSTESKECGEGDREKALARLRAASAW